MFKGTCQQVMVIITYRSTALSESDFSICNAIGVKTGMQKMKTSFNHNFTTNTTRHCFEADSLSPVESPVCRSEAGFSRYAYVCSATTALLGSRPVESTDSPGGTNRRIMESPPGMRHQEYIKAALHPSQGPTLIPFGFGTVPYLCQYNNWV